MKKLTNCPMCDEILDSKMELTKDEKIIYYICYNCKWNNFYSEKKGERYAPRFRR